MASSSNGPESNAQQAIEQIRRAQPDLRFRIDAILADGDLVAVVGAASHGPQPDIAGTRLVWLIHLEGGRMAEMRTDRVYRHRSSLHTHISVGTA